MKQITDCRPSALLTEIGWGQGEYGTDTIGLGLTPEEMADYIRLGQADGIGCMCLIGALKAADELGCFASNIARDAFNQLLWTNYRKGWVDGKWHSYPTLIDFNDDDMTTEAMVKGLLIQTEVEFGLTEPRPIQPEKEID